MNFKQVTIVGIKDIKEGGYALLLQEIDTERKIALIVGPAEASSIMLKLHNKANVAKLTHQLMSEMAQNFGIQLQQMVIVEPAKFTYQARLTWSNGEQTWEQIGRASDGIALALWFNKPIYADEQILEHWNEKQKTETVATTDTNFDKKNNNELQELLQQAIEDENYELAAKLRDEIRDRSLPF